MLKTVSNLFSGYNRRHGIFLPRDEFFVLAFPFFLLFVIAIEIIYSLKFGYTERFSFMIIEKFLLLNLGHTMLTFGLLFLPEMSKWIETEEGGRKFWFELFSIHGLLFIFTGVSAYVMLATKQYEMFLFIETIRALTATFHLLQQLSGFSALYDSRSGRIALPKSRAVEKFIILSFFASLAVRILFIPDWSLLAASKYISRQNVSLLSNIIFGLSLFLGLWYFFSNLTGEKTSWFKKLYSIRIFTWVFAPFSVVAGYSTGALHGVEYLALYRKMFSNSEATKSLKTKIHAYVLVTMIPLILWSVTRTSFHLKGFSLIDIRSVEFPELSLVLISLFTGLSYAFQIGHYYIDGRIFRMKDKSNRAVISGLMK